MNNPFDAHWKIENKIETLVSFPIVRMIFMINKIDWKRGWSFFGVPIIQKHQASIMIFGANLQLRSNAKSNPLGASHPVILCTWLPNSRLEIGDYFGMTGGSIVAAKKIVIGNNVNIGANSIISDTDFHPLDAMARKIDSSAGKSAPIEIEDDVFIGMNSIILKGVHIGKGSVIGAGSVVTKSIPAGVIAAGNPARVIRKICPEEK